MSVVKAHAHPRASLLGNPSDLYGGAGVAFAFVDCRAEATLRDDAPSEPPARLVAAAWQVFAAHARERGHATPPALPLALTFASDIPRQVGLAGSSAIVMACLRAFALRHALPIDATTLARLTLAAEVDVLGIRAGPMDRLAQAHGGLVQMDFARPFEPSSTTRLPARLLPELLIAWDSAPKDSGAVHQPVYERWLARDPEVLAVIAEYRPLVAAGVAALRAGDRRELQRCMDHNFDLRARLFAIRPRDRAMIDLGRARGAATKFCGSGGAVLVLPREPGELAALAAGYRAAGFHTLLPHVEDPA